MTTWACAHAKSHGTFTSAELDKTKGAESPFLKRRQCPVCAALTALSQPGLMGFLRLATPADMGTAK